MANGGKGKGQWQPRQVGDINKKVFKN